MATQNSHSFSDSQLKAIISFQSKLKKTTSRNVTLAEAIVNWIALGYAEEYRSGYLVQENRAN